jgi:hypothetical protein
LNKFGSRCLLTDTICQTNENSTSLNNGQYISNHDDLLFNQNFIFICQKNSTGNLSERADNKLIISFNKNIDLSPQIFIHFIKIEVDYPDQLMESTVRSTTFQTIPFQQDLVYIF